uniref:Uncharacterized protein n=1 Tax=Anguilla anguilla TaxID=7936 RepID=A0A0E9SME9_ANGAN
MSQCGMSVLTFLSRTIRTCFYTVSMGLRVVLHVCVQLVLQLVI